MKKIIHNELRNICKKFIDYVIQSLNKLTFHNENNFYILYKESKTLSKLNLR